MDIDKPQPRPYISNVPLVKQAIAKLESELK